MRPFSTVIGALGLAAILAPAPAVAQSSHNGKPGLVLHVDELPPVALSEVLVVR